MTLTGSPTATTPEPPFVLILLADLLLFGTTVVVLQRRGILRASIQNSKSKIQNT
jgi:hypothetical protein